MTHEQSLLTCAAYRAHASEMDGSDEHGRSRGCGIAVSKGLTDDTAPTHTHHAGDFTVIDAYMGSVASALKSHIDMKAQPEIASKTVPGTLY